MQHLHKVSDHTSFELFKNIFICENILNIILCQQFIKHSARFL